MAKLRILCLLLVVLIAGQTAARPRKNGRLPRKSSRAYGKDKICQKGKAKDRIQCLYDAYDREWKRAQAVEKKRAEMGKKLVDAEAKAATASLHYDRCDKQLDASFRTNKKLQEKLSKADSLILKIVGRGLITDKPKSTESSKPIKQAPQLSECEKKWASETARNMFCRKR